MRKSGYVILEGNIGVGKSTLSKALERAFIDMGLNAEAIPEPDEKTNPFLAAYYENPKENAYKMQMYLLHRRFKSTARAIADAKAGLGWYILDRSYYGDICFAKVQVKDGYFTDAEYAAYMDAHDTMRGYLDTPTAAVFLRAPVDVIQSRIAKRSRDCECGIKAEYLESLQNEIDSLEKVLSRRCPVLSMDWSKPLDDVEMAKKAHSIAEAMLEAADKDPWRV